MLISPCYHYKLLMSCAGTGSLTEVAAVTGGTAEKQVVKPGGVIRGNTVMYCNCCHVVMSYVLSPPAGFGVHIPHGRWVVPTTTLSLCRHAGAARWGRRPRWRTAHRPAGPCSPRERRPSLCSSHPTFLVPLGHTQCFKCLKSTFQWRV